MSEANPQTAATSAVPTEPFPYSVSAPPPADVLRERLFAVHVTPILPHDGVMIPGARDISGRGHWRDDIPSFRPTLHFSLGEVVRRHGDHSWDETEYALVAPLSSLENQLVNLSPHDTFILGRLALRQDMVLVVPEGTDTGSLPRVGPSIHRYNPEQGVRSAVDDLIAEREGWQVRMQDQGVSNGDFARVNGIDINDPTFFRNLLEELPWVGFGTHIRSELGESYRFGLVEQAINRAMKTYSDHWLTYSSADIRVYREIVLDNLATLRNFLTALPAGHEALEDFEEKERMVRGWMAILSCDLWARKHLGKMLAHTGDIIQEQVRGLRQDPMALIEWVEDNQHMLPDSEEEHTIGPQELAEMLVNMTQAEVDEFLKQQGELTEPLDMHTFYAEYAIRRWLLIRTDRAREEGLDRLLEQTLPGVVPKRSDTLMFSFFESIGHVLSDETNRMADALDVLSGSAIRDWLEEQYGFDFAHGAPKDLNDVLRAHPKTRILFAKKEVLPADDQETLHILNDLGLFDWLRSDEPVINQFSSFEQARRVAWGIEWRKERVGLDILRARLPISSTPRLEDAQLGIPLSLYQLMERDIDIDEMWARVGLADEFREVFPDNELFWNTNQSLIEIYEMLVAMSTAQN